MPVQAGAPDPRDISDADDFGRALKRQKDHAGLTVREVARRLGMPSATLGGYFSGRHLPPMSRLPGFLELLRVIHVDDAGLQPWVEALERVKHREAKVPGPPTASPYLGLRSFQLTDHDLFFGRETELAQLTSMVGHRPHGAPHIVAVVGSSGSGKSSLLRAGLVADMLRLNPTLRHRIITPGAAPIEALRSVWDELTESPGALQQGLLDPPNPVLLIVDQFEELFTLGADERVQEAFVDTLCRLASDPGGHTVVCIGLRADFYGEAIRMDALADVLTQRQVVIGGLTQHDVERIILEPARRHGITVDRQLLDLLLRDLGRPDGDGDGEASYSAGILPRLSHALLATFNQSGGLHFTVEDYLATGGIERAVARTAEHIYGEFDSDSRQIVRELFMRMVNVDSEHGVTRRRVRHADLPALWVESGVVERFVAARLLSTDETYVDMTHEALVSAWPRLVRWVEADRASLAMLRQVRSEAAAWVEAGRDDSYLLWGAKLQVVREATSNPRWWHQLSDEEQEFITASSAVQEQERRELLADTVAGAAERLMTVDSGLAAELAIRSYLCADTVRSRSMLLQSSVAPLIRRHVTDGREVAVAADRTGETIVGCSITGLVSVFRSTEQHHAPALVGSGSLLLRDALRFRARVLIAVRYDGGAAAVAEVEDRITLVDLSDHRCPQAGATITMPAGAVAGALAADPNRPVLVVGTRAGDLLRYDISDPRHPRALTGMSLPGMEIRTLAFDPSGQRLVVGSVDGIVQLLSVDEPLGAGRGGRHTDTGDATAATGAGGGRARLTEVGYRRRGRIDLGSRNGVLCAAFSGAGDVLAVSGHSTTVQVIDSTDLERPVLSPNTIGEFVSAVTTVQISTSGRIVIAAGRGGWVRAFDLATGEIVEGVRTPDQVTSSACGYGGRPLMLAGADGGLRTLRAPDGVANIRARDIVFATTFSADGGLLAIGPGDADGRILLHRVHSRRHVAPPISLDAGPGAAVHNGPSVIHPDGHLVAAGTLEGAVHLWDVREPADPRLTVLPEPTEMTQHVAFSADGTLLAAAGDDNLIHLWQLGAGAPTYLGRKEGSTDCLIVVAFTPDGRHLLALGGDGPIRLWSVHGGTRPLWERDPGHRHGRALTISPDGRLLATAGSDKSIRVWDLADLITPVLVGDPVSGPGGDIFQLDFNGDGTQLAAGVTDGSTWIWTVRSDGWLAHRATLGLGHSPVMAVGYDRSGSTLAIGGEDGLVRLYETSDEAALAELWDPESTPISEEEVRRYVPGIDDDDIDLLLSLTPS